MEQITVSALAQFIILTAGAVGSLAAAMRWLVKALDKRIDERDQRMAEQLDRKLTEKLEPIERELRPNSGRSLWDRVDAMARAKVDEHQAMDQRHAENRVEFDHLRDSHHALRRGIVAYLRKLHREGQLDPETQRIEADTVRELERLDANYERRNRRPRRTEHP